MNAQETRHTEGDARAVKLDADIGSDGDCGWQPNVNVSSEEAGRGGHVVPALPRSLGPAKL